MKLERLGQTCAPGNDPIAALQILLTYWLAYPGLDSAAFVATGRLRAHVAANPADYQSTCFIELHRAVSGDTVGVRETVRQLLPSYESGHMHPVCPAMVEAFVESQDVARTDTPALDRFESVIRQGQWQPLLMAGPIVLARLRRQRGQYDEALAAARIHVHGNFYKLFRTPHLKEEGDLAVLTGDTASAIEAYGRYLDLRTDPDPGPVQEEVDQVRAALERSLRARG